MSADKSSTSSRMNTATPMFIAPGTEHCISYSNISGLVAVFFGARKPMVAPWSFGVTEMIWGPSTNDSSWAEQPMAAKIAKHATTTNDPASVHGYIGVNVVLTRRHDKASRLGY